MQTDERSAEVHLALRTDCRNVFRLVGENQRLKTAPGVGHAEQAEVIQIRGQLLIIEFLIQYKGEQAAAAGEITLPELMPFTAGQCRVVHAGDLRMAGQPLGDL